MAVKIRMKKMGRRHRPFFRICATDARSPRDGKVIEELGYYDPMVRETDARAVLVQDRIDYWLSVGAQPSDKVKVLIKKYGSQGTHLDQQRQALERLQAKPQPPEPVRIPRPAPEPPQPTAPSADEERPAPADATPPAEVAVAGETAADETTAGETAAGETAADETTAGETTAGETAAETPAEDASAEEKNQA